MDDDAVVASEQKIADLFAESGQIAAAPKFGDWVDRRYNDALRPLLISANQEFPCQIRNYHRKIPYSRPPRVGATGTKISSRSTSKRRCGGRISITP